MAKNSVTDYDTTAANNTDIGGIAIEGSDNVANFDNALRELMSHLKDEQTSKQSSIDEKLPLSGGTLTGSINFSGNSITNLASINGGVIGQDRNLITNGNFDVWQEATSFTLTSSGDYVADCWVAGCGTSGAGTFYRASHSLGDNPKYFAVLDQTTGGNTSPFVSGRIEDVRKLQGVITASFKASANTDITVQIIARQYFGTGGSPSATVDTVLGSVNITTVNTVHKVSATVPTIAGKTLGTNNDDYCELLITLPTLTAFQFYLYEVGLYKGDLTGETNPFSARDITEEENRCKRQYFKGYLPLRGIAAGTSALRMASATQVTMRSVPSATISGNVYDGSAAPAITGISASYNSNNAVELDLSLASAVTLGRAAVFYETGSQYLILDSRL